MQVCLIKPIIQEEKNFCNKYFLCNLGSLGKGGQVFEVRIENVELRICRGMWVTARVYEYVVEKRQKL
jgi:hypothetical protein